MVPAAAGLERDADEQDPRPETPVRVPCRARRGRRSYNKVLQREVILLAVVTDEVPEVDAAKRLRLEPLPRGLYRMRAHYGFMERPHVREIIARCRDLGLKTPTDDTTYYLGRMRLVPTGPAPMMRWRKRLLGLRARNASSVPDFSSIPPDRVVELGVCSASRSVAATGDVMPDPPGMTCAARI